MNIKFSRAFTDGKELNDGVLSIAGGKFVEPKGDQIDLDLSEYLVFPGFIDMHTHGALGYDYTLLNNESELDALSEFYATNGVCYFLGTTITENMNTIKKSVEIMKKKMKIGFEHAEMIGIYLEGPFLAESFKGAHNADLLVFPTGKNIKTLFGDNPDVIKIITVAPELPDAIGSIKALTESGIRVSLGHSGATMEQAKAGIAAGATIFVHTFNAMSPLKHRDIGMVGTALLSDDCYAEVICDLIHVCPEAIQIIYRSKPKDKIILITDSVEATGMPDGEYSLGSLPVFVKNGTVRLKDGTLAGSSLRSNIALKNYVEKVGATLAEGGAALTSNPAAALGLSGQIGTLNLGASGSITALDYNFNVKLTIKNGNIVYKSQKK